VFEDMDVNSNRSEGIVSLRKGDLMKQRRAGEFIGGILGNLIALVLFNTALAWRHLTHGVILPTWGDILWAANFSLIIQIALNLILVFYRPAWLYSFRQLIAAAVGLVSIIVFYIVFPVDFAQIDLYWINRVLRLILIIGMAGTCIGIIVNFVRLITGKQYASA
jgi:hypothetical protein